MVMGILFTILTGLFFLIGIYAFKKIKNKEKTSLFTISLSFVVMFGLVFFHLLPELIETKNLFLVIPTILGFLLIIVLDLFIPHHHHEHSDNSCDKEDHELHINHIGIVTIIALTIHNLIEGIALYGVTLSSVTSGLLMMFSISCHNIPLGFQIGNSMQYKKNSNLLIFILCASSFIGALIMILFGSLNEFILHILLAFTLGMLYYILLFELFNEIRKSFNKKETIYGIVFGILILFLMLII